MPIYPYRMAILIYLFIYQLFTVAILIAKLAILMLKMAKMANGKAMGKLDTLKKITPRAGACSVNLRRGKAQVGGLPYGGNRAAQVPVWPICGQGASGRQGARGQGA